MKKKAAAPERRTVRKMINLYPHEWKELEALAARSLIPSQAFLREALLFGARAQNAGRRRRRVGAR